MTSLPDQSHRDLALDVVGSFIVQAPAGSGKTELLTLRYLRLLSISDEPEEVLAITFTRKAASEMKDRIVRALKDAAEAGPAPTFKNSLEKNRHQAARAALQRATQCQWNILEHSGRLRIQTIDSFCFSLASRIPLLSRLGGSPNVSDDVQPCFDLAISNTLSALNASGELARDIADLLSHLDNDVSLVEKLLSDLLRNRDQWLPYVLDIHSNQGMDRDYLLSSLDELICEALTEVYEHLAHHEEDVVELLNHAASHLPSTHHRFIDDYQQLTSLPHCAPDSMAYWLLLEAILLTKTDASWRARIDKRDGFPTVIPGDPQLTAVCKQHKDLWQALLEKLNDNKELLEALGYLRRLPDPNLEDRQWDFLTALARVLRHLSIQLQLAFRNLKMVDHVQVAAAALGALGTEDEPTDLALALDHRIQHILVDEFQDTSRLQTGLLEKLTAGWEPADGRTLFLVGDAMQSVYGFRNANVGIYLSVREEGLGHIKPEPLVLRTNFRSQATIVEWVNTVFSAAFPARENPSRGAVAYTPSVANEAALPQWGISTDLITCEQEDKNLALETEAERIAQRIQHIRTQDPSGSVAILVRNRSHLTTLVPKLREAGIHWQATDIDKLDSLPVIDDLQSLTRALLNHGDRIAWLALLRAPWCGLSLTDIHTLTGAAGDGTLWSSMARYRDLHELSADGQQRLADFTKVLAYVLTLRSHFSLHRLVEAAWTMLRGAALARSEAEQDSVAYFLELLKHHEQGGTLRSYQGFADKVATAFVPSRARIEAEGAVHLMTMHKAKGLEFDHVILPALGAESRSSEKSLLQWHERINHQGEARLFIAALSPAGADDDPLYGLLRFEDRRKSEYEDVRLLYIATTRARKSAHLSSTLIRNSDGEAKPKKGSLLHYIWPRLEELGGKHYETVDLEQLSVPRQDVLPGSTVTETGSPVTSIERFSAALQITDHEHDFINVVIDSAIKDQVPEEPADRRFETEQSKSDSATALKATAGTLIHQALEHLVRSPDLISDQRSLNCLQQYWRRRLRLLATDPRLLSDTLAFIQTSLESCLADSETAWLFDPGLQDSRTEAPVSRLVAGRLQHFVIDRTFVDGEGTRWIVDYKTTSPEPDIEVEEFIVQQCQLHSVQLATYRSLFEQIESRTIRTALLFTSLPKLVEV
jgi:ATP-dependent exoDNAse (exonuclease V) beta subunit